MANDFKAVVRSISDLPPMPLVAIKVMDILGDANVSYSTLVQIISHDPAVSARLLKVANSAFYSMKRQIKTLDHAIVIVGERTFRSLVLAASLEGMNKSYGLLEKLLWEDAIGCAVGCRVLARRYASADPEEAFLAGLFRHLGKIVMNYSEPEHYRALVEAAYVEGDITPELEGRFFPYAHAVVGAAVLDKWNFSRSLVMTTLHHADLKISQNDEDDEHDDKALLKLTATVNFSGNICLRLGIGQREPQEDLVLMNTPGAQVLGLDEDQVEAALTEVAEVFNDNREFFVD